MQSFKGNKQLRINARPPSLPAVTGQPEVRRQKYSREVIERIQGEFNLGFRRNVIRIHANDFDWHYFGVDGTDICVNLMELYYGVEDGIAPVPFTFDLAVNRGDETEDYLRMFIPGNIPAAALGNFGHCKILENQPFYRIAVRQDPSPITGGVPSPVIHRNIVLYTMNNPRIYKELMDA